ncbi:hypothetical protein FOQG_18917 [Fusarium oxysporum f. sp. raphani 54005]|uniref:Uncharacterized protein n=1 Tax=Fusarium oxysporum f. sp. raphani 54005 TaxID=1089458 RepID=X0B2J8_FUSOX|nr:hypothetical protein FOQG_18917 [Fusarium oxysporum f. sp. raphani 54005]
MSCSYVCQGWVKCMRRGQPPAAGRVFRMSRLPLLLASVALLPSSAAVKKSYLEMSSSVRALSNMISDGACQTSLSPKKGRWTLWEGRTRRYAGFWHKLKGSEVINYW